MQTTNIEKCMLLSSQVYVGDGVVDSVAIYLADEFREGALLVLYEEDNAYLMDKIARNLKKNGYRISLQKVCSTIHLKNDKEGIEVQEFTRHILAVGGGQVTDIAKRVASDLSIDFSLILTMPCDDTILIGKCPKQVFIDENVLINSSNEQVASSYGYLLAHQLSQFENEFARLVLAEKRGEYCLKEIDKMTMSKLCVELLKISSEKQGEDSADIMSKIMQATAISKSKKPRLMGEYKFIASVAIAAFYKAFLSALSLDIMPPRDLFFDSDKLQKIGVNLTECQKRIDFFDINVYFRISYILGEYRTDLIDKLSHVDIHQTARFFRRLYDDALYHLKSEMSAKEVIGCMALAGLMSDNLLGYAYASGVMNRF